MSELTIEAGKFYKTRDGHKAHVYATGRGGPFPIHGAIPVSNGHWSQISWTEDGFQWGTKQPEDADLIAEWIDLPEVNWSAMPAWAQWVAMDQDGMWTGSECPLVKNEIIGRWFSNSYLKFAVPEDYAPTWSGDWRQSLVQRPEGGK